MTESIITISIVGLLAGIIFSMPIAGPISILITTNALKGRFRYCVLVNFGASFATFTYVFGAVYGLTKLYSFYKPAIPYLFSLGSILLLYIGYKIFITKIDFEHFEDKSQMSEKIKKKEKGGFYTGCLINFLNPTLFIGWLTSTFLVISFVSSLGFNTGDLEIFIDRSVKEISNFESSINDSLILNSPVSMDVRTTHSENARFPTYFHLLISVFYALFVSVGSVTWFYFLAFLITRFRKAINISFVSRLVKVMGVVLCLIGLYFVYLGSQLFLNLQIS